jgi:hypothetical protein
VPVALLHEGDADAAQVVAIDERAGADGERDRLAT